MSQIRAKSREADMGTDVDSDVMDVAQLADLLRETAEHHGNFEKITPPHDWWDWYAPYMAARQHGSTPEEASAAAGLYMKEVRHIVPNE
jgi:hypothetical protein